MVTRPPRVHTRGRSSTGKRGVTVAVEDRVRDAITVTNRPTASSRTDLAPGEYRRVRGFLLACTFAAMVVGTIGQLVMPAHGSPLVAWLDTAVIPAVVVMLFLVGGPDRPILLALTLGLYTSSRS